MTIKTYKEFVDKIYNEIHKIQDNVPAEYLNEAGLATLRAWRAVYWYTSFHETFASLKEDEQFSQLSSNTSEHPAYHRIINKINNFLDKVA